MKKTPATSQGHADDALIQEHEDYMRKVEVSAVPKWMLDQYEYRPKTRAGSDDDLEEILQGRNEDILTEEEEDITGDV